MISGLLRKISVQLTLGFFVLGFIPLFFITLIDFYQFRSVILQHETANLRTLLQTRSSLIASELQSRTLLAKAVASDRSLQSDFEFLETRYRPATKKSAAYLSLMDGVRQHHQKRLLQFGFHDLFYISREGEIFFSVRQEADYGENLLNE